MCTSVPIQAFDSKLGRLVDGVVVDVVRLLLGLCGSTPSHLDVMVESVGDVHLRHLPDAYREEAEASQGTVLSRSVGDLPVRDEFPQLVAVDVMGPAISSIASEDTPEWSVFLESSACTP